MLTLELKQKNNDTAHHEQLLLHTQIGNKGPAREATQRDKIVVQSSKCTTRAYSGWFCSLWRGFAAHRGRKVQPRPDVVIRYDSVPVGRSTAAYEMQNKNGQ